MCITFQTYPASENEEDVDDPSPLPSLNSTTDIDVTELDDQNLPGGQSSTTSDELASGSNAASNSKEQAGKKRFKSPKKLAPRKRNEDPRVEEAYQILKSRAAGVANEKKDECSTFASYICEKMRKLDGTKRAILMYEIHGLILQAELGTQTSSRSQSPSSLSNYHSLSSSAHPPPISPANYSLTSPPHFNSAYLSPISSPLSSSTPSPHTPYSFYSSPVPSPHNYSTDFSQNLPTNFSQNPSLQTYPHNLSPSESTSNPSSEPNSNEFADTVSSESKNIVECNFSFPTDCKCNFK